MAVGLCFVGLLGFGAYTCAVQTRDTKRTSIAYLEALAAENYEAAYAMLSPALQAKIGPQDLATVFGSPRLAGLEKPKVHQTVGYDYGACARASAKLEGEGRTPVFLWVKDGLVHDIYLPPKDARVFTRKEGVWYCKFGD